MRMHYVTPDGRVPTLAFIYVGRNAGQVRLFDWEWKLSPELAEHCVVEFVHPDGYYSLRRRADGWYLIAHAGCAWDFATGWIDWDWLKEASLGHDVLHWLIKRGVLPDSKAVNRLIDRELMLIARARGQTFGLKPRSWIIKTATNLLDQKSDGEGRRVHFLYGETV